MSSAAPDSYFLHASFQHNSSSKKKQGFSIFSFDLSAVVLFRFNFPLLLICSLFFFLTWRFFIFGRVPATAHVRLSVPREIIFSCKEELKGPEEIIRKKRKNEEIRRQKKNTCIQYTLLGWTARLP
jgi:hypothetical protein